MTKWMNSINNARGGDTIEQREVEDRFLCFLYRTCATGSVADRTSRRADAAVSSPAPCSGSGFARRRPCPRRTTRRTRYSRTHPCSRTPTSPRRCCWWRRRAHRRKSGRHAETHTSRDWGGPARSCLRAGKSPITGDEPGSGGRPRRESEQAIVPSVSRCNTTPGEGSVCTSRQGGSFTGRPRPMADA